MALVLVHRKYLLSYGGPNWILGYWKKLLDNPPCKKPGEPKNKQYSYEFELVKGEKNIIYMHLVGLEEDLNEIERQLSKFKIARIENDCELILILDANLSFNYSIDSFLEFCKDHRFIITGKQIYQR